MSVTSPPSSRNITLAEVAQAAGLSRATVSYALRGHPRFSAATIARVQRAAAELGYKPDLRIKSLMTAIRHRTTRRSREPLAFIWLQTPRQKTKLAPHILYFAEAVRDGARRRAHELGCSLEEFWLEDGEMRPERLHQILRSRGITGCVLCTAASNAPVVLDWDWSPFATVLVGATEFSPTLHRSAHHHYRSLCSTLRRLRDEGWRRPAAVLSQSVQKRTHQAQVAAFLAQHPEPRLALDLYRLSQPEAFAAMEPWPAELAPDALIVGWQLDAPTLAVLRTKVPTARRIVTLDWYPHGVLPGIDPMYGELSARAVDLVVEQLHRNSLGIPQLPMNVLAEGVWREPPAPH